MLCSGCPRSYHYECLDKEFRARSRGNMTFRCPQHQCIDCEQKTADSGGLIFRCRWCERGYCEDCLEWEKTELVGENLKEYELLGFPAVSQAFYISCPSCKDYHAEDSGTREFYEKMALQYDAQHAEALDEKALVAAVAEVAKKPILPPSRAESLTDATTLDCSGISTPQLGALDPTSASVSRKRKAKPEMLLATPSKRVRVTKA